MSCYTFEKWFGVHRERACFLISNALFSCNADKTNDPTERECHNLISSISNFRPPEVLLTTLDYFFCLLYLNKLRLTFLSPVYRQFLRLAVTVSVRLPKPPSSCANTVRLLIV